MDSPDESLVSITILRQSAIEDIKELQEKWEKYNDEYNDSFQNRREERIERDALTHLIGRISFVIEYIKQKFNVCDEDVKNA